MAWVTERKIKILHKYSYREPKHTGAISPATYSDYSESTNLATDGYAKSCGGGMVTNVPGAKAYRLIPSKENKQNTSTKSCGHVVMQSCINHESGLAATMQPLRPIWILSWLSAWAQCKTLDRKVLTQWTSCPLV